MNARAPAPPPGKVDRAALGAAEPARLVGTLALMLTAIFRSFGKGDFDRSELVIVRRLLATGKLDADSKNDDGRTPLSWAAEGGSEAVVENAPCH